VLLSLCPLSARLHPRPSCLHIPSGCLSVLLLSTSPAPSFVPPPLPPVSTTVWVPSLSTPSLPARACTCISCPTALAASRPRIPPLSLLEWPGHMERGHGYTDNATCAAPGLCTTRTGSYHSVDGCATCGYPYCPQCYRNHLCQRDALLRVYPQLQCRYCSRPQETGNGLSRCARCLESACVGSDLCPSQIVTTHCQCHADLCAECASWRLVASTTRRRMCECHLPTLAWRYICNRC
jgi:hypothetical protein